MLEAYQNSLKCQHCNTINCLKHNRIHDRAACEGFENTQESKEASAAEQESEQTFQNITHRCPNCNNRIERSGGCAHMICGLNKIYKSSVHMSNCLF